MDDPSDMFPYSHDYYSHLLRKENTRSKQYQFKGRSPELCYRKDLIKNLKKLSDKLDLGVTTFHVSIHLLDYFMDRHKIEPHQLMLTGSTCLYVAAKFVDLDNNVPHIRQLVAINNYQNTKHEYQIMEMMLLEFWKWDLNCATTSHFLEHFLSCDLFPLYERELDPCRFQIFKNQAVHLANLTLLELQFIHFKPSIIAASCIAVIRIQFQLFPIWPSKLEAITNYSYPDIDLCVQHVFHLAQTNQCESFNYINHPVQPHHYYMYQEKQDWADGNLKAPMSVYNGAKIKRRNLVQPNDLKKMYCAV